MCKLMFVAFVVVMIPFLLPLNTTAVCLMLFVLLVYAWVMCQGQIVPISLIRASENDCICGYSKGSKRGASCFKYDTCNILRYKSSVYVKIQTH